MKAIWKDQVLAVSDDTVVVEGNHYFPPESVDRRFLESSDTTTVCGWKGAANYYSVVVGDDRNAGCDCVYELKRDDWHVSWRGIDRKQGEQDTQ